MALLTVNAQFKLDALPERLEALPRYARPLFLRMVGEVKSTETFKPKRRAYVERVLTPCELKTRSTYSMLDCRLMSHSTQNVTRLFETAP